MIQRSAAYGCSVLFCSNGPTTSPRYEKIRKTYELRQAKKRNAPAKAQQTSKKKKTTHDTPIANNEADNVAHNAQVTASLNNLTTTITNMTSSVANSQAEKLLIEKLVIGVTTIGAGRGPNKGSKT